MLIEPLVRYPQQANPGFLITTAPDLNFSFDFTASARTSCLELRGIITIQTLHSKFVFEVDVAFSLNVQPFHCRYLDL